jgi:Domain of unknown function (DUF6265)
MTCSSRAAAAGLLFAAFALAASAQPASLDRLAWMVGTWSGTDNDGFEMVEHWTDSKGGVMLGLHRDVKAGKAVSFEFMRIQATPGGIVLFASPRGAPPTPFPMAEIGDRRIVFANPEHDFPQRIIYRLTPDGSLNARVEGAVKGKTRSEEWTWKRSLGSTLNR